MGSQRQTWLSDYTFTFKVTGREIYEAMFQVKNTNINIRIVNTEKLKWV